MLHLSNVFTGLNGAMGLYSGVKGLLDKSAASKKAKELRNRAKADEDAWYKRNYYESFLDSTAARAAMKRVENSLRRNNEQNTTISRVKNAIPKFDIRIANTHSVFVSNYSGSATSAFR